MVAVYLDHGSVEKLTQEYPGVTPDRLRKVVIQYNPPEDQRSLYEPLFGGLATVQVWGAPLCRKPTVVAASDPVMLILVSGNLPLCSFRP